MEEQLIQKVLVSLPSADEVYKKEQQQQQQQQNT